MFIPVYLMNIKLRSSIGTLGLEVVVGIIIYTGMILILKPTSLTVILKLVKQNNKSLKYKVIKHHLLIIF